jgi:hypothetical protein
MQDELPPEELIVAESQWSETRRDLRSALKRLEVPKAKWPQSLHWSWAGKAEDLELLEAAGFGVKFEGIWQGVMLTKSATHMSLLSKTRGKPLIYVDFLEVAPWNWSIAEIGQLPKFKGIGSMLFREAILLSLEEGFGGRVGLHALPQADQFYQVHCAMETLGPDSAKRGLKYFELTGDGAQRFLAGG